MHSSSVYLFFRNFPMHNVDHFTIAHSFISQQSSSSTTSPNKNFEKLLSIDHHDKEQRRRRPQTIWDCLARVCFVGRLINVLFIHTVSGHTNPPPRYSKALKFKQTALLYFVSVEAPNQMMAWSKKSTQRLAFFSDRRFLLVMLQAIRIFELFLVSNLSNQFAPLPPPLLKAR